MKLTGRFAYTADVVPKGARKPRREALFGVMEYEIEEVSPDDLTPDALVVTPHLGEHERDDSVSVQRMSYAGWDGRLWRPIVPRTYDGTPPQVMTRERFAAALQTTFPLRPTQRMPIDEAYGTDFGPGAFRMGDEQLESKREDAYDGRILSDDRAGSIARHTAAAKRMIVVGDILHAEQYEPCWRFTDVMPNTGISLRWHSGHDLSAHSFRLDRLADLLDWIKRPQGDFTTSGEIHAIDPAFLRRDDLSHHLNSHLDTLLNHRVAELMPYLPEQALLDWADLKRNADKHGEFGDRPFAGDVDQAIARLRGLREAIAAGRVPTSMIAQRDGVVARAFATFMARVEFELARRPALGIAPDDDVAIGSLAAR